MTVLWIDGDWREDDTPLWTADDRGALLGDGVFETVRVRGGAPVGLPRHLTLLRRSCEALGLDLPQVAYTELLPELARRNDLEDAAVRITLSAGPGPRGLDRAEGVTPRLLLTAAARPQPPEALSLATSVIRRAPTSLAATHKTLGYTDNLAARREARADGADMALIVDTNGNLSGTDCGNLFWVDNERLWTPSTACAIRPGTARARILERLDVGEGCYPPGTLQRAACIFVTNAVMGAVPVTRIDGQPMGGQHPLFDRVAKILA